MTKHTSGFLTAHFAPRLQAHSAVRCFWQGRCLKFLPGQGSVQGHKWSLLFVLIDETNHNASQTDTLTFYSQCRVEETFQEFKTRYPAHSKNTEQNPGTAQYNVYMSNADTATWSICRYRYQSDTFISTPSCCKIRSLNNYVIRLYWQ